MNDAKEERKAAFVRKKGFDKIKSPADWVLGVSHGNEKQGGEDLMLFVNEINNNPEKINSIEIVLTHYLHRHYEDEEYALNAQKDYVAKNKHILEKIKLNGGYKITLWQDVIKDSLFKEALEKTKSLYENNKIFKRKIAKVAKRHCKNDEDFESAESYLLEEAAYFIYKKGYLTYPADSLNMACMYLIENLYSELKYIPYSLPSMKKKRTSLTFFNDNSNVAKKEVFPSSFSFPPVLNHLNSGTSDLIGVCAYFSSMLDKNGLVSIEKKRKFFDNYLQFTESCTKLIPDPIEGSDTSEPTFKNGNSRNY